MKQSKVSTLTENGNTFKDFTGYTISFEDGTHGSCLAKKPAWYNVGDEVRYELNGEYNGVPKIKVHKLEDQAGGGSHSGGGKSGGGKSTYDTLGPQIGHALSNATTLLLAAGEEVTVENLMKYSKVYFKAAAMMRKAIEANNAGAPATPPVNQEQVNAGAAQEGATSPAHTPVDPEEDCPF